MRAWVLLISLSACSFNASLTDPDASMTEVLPPDVPDGAAPMRIRQNLVGLWTFFETSGQTANDVATSTPVDLTVQVGTISWNNGWLEATQPFLLYSAPAPHLNPDCLTSGAVTLEAWVHPSAAMQGTESQPAMIAGLTFNFFARNIGLLQAGNKWLGRVRTAGDDDGKPDLLSTSTTQTLITHLVVVADATQRRLYVNGVAETNGTPGAPSAWDPSFRMALGNEPSSQNRPWTGSLGLVAIYNKALTAAEVEQNFRAGPDGM